MAPGPVPSAPSTLVRYGIAVAAVLVSTLAALWLAPHSYQTPFLPFYPAVIIAVWFGGFRPGILATVLASLSANYYMLPPHNAFNLDAISLAQTAFFVLTFTVICWFADLARQRLHSVIDVQSQLLEMSFDPVIVRDAVDRVIYWNRGAEQLYGWSKDEAFGQVTHDLLRTIHPKPLDEIRAEMNQTGRWHGELVHTRKNGSTVVVESWWTLQKAGGGQSAILESNYDLSERKKAEESLRYVSAIVESSDAAIIGKTLDGIITSWNPGAERLYGYTAAEMIGQPISRLSPTGHPNEFPTILKRLAQGERIETYDTIRQHKDGAVIDVSLKVSPIFDDAAKIIGASSIARDIRKRKQMETALRRSEERLRAATSAAEIGVWYWNPGSSYVEVSANWRQLFGVPPEAKVTFETWRDAIHPEDRDRAVAELNAASEQHREFNTEYRIVRPDGALRWIVDRGRATYDEHGRAVSMAGVNVDITERKRAEQALRASEQRVRHLLDSLFVFVGVLELDGTLIEANRAALIAAGIRAQDVIGKKFWDCYWWSYDPQAQEQLRQSIERARSGEMVRYDVPVRMAEGLMTIDFALSPMRDQQGNITHLIPSGVDISERKRTEEALRESEQQFRTLADSIPQLAWMANPDGWIFWYNRRWYEYTGTTPEKMKGWGWQSVHDPAQLPAVLERWQSSLQTGNTFDMVFPLRGADGVFRPFLTRVLPLKDASGKVMRWFGTNTDISAQKQAEEALVKHEKLATVGRMAATIAHEINNPLAAAMNALYLVAAEPKLPANARGPLQLAEHELERVAHITKQTLGFYRESGNAAKVQLTEVLDGILSLFGPKLKNRTLRVQRRYRSAASAFGVEGEIRQMVSNLVANSIDAMPQNGTLHVRTCGPVCLNGQRPMVRITIADTGAGITPDCASRIFEPFFTTKAAIGTGLGLWVTKELVTKHEGRIRMRSQVGKGTVFTIWLPSERRRGERVGSAGAA